MIYVYKTEQQFGVNKASISFNLVLSIYLAKMSWITEHVNIEKLGDVTASVHVISFTKTVPYLGALTINYSPFLCSSSCRTNVTNQIP